MDLERAAPEDLLKKKRKKKEGRYRQARVRFPVPPFFFL